MLDGIDLILVRHAGKPHNIESQHGAGAVKFLMFLFYWHNAHICKKYLSAGGLDSVLGRPVTNR